MPIHNNSIPTPLRVVFVEDSEDDVVAFNRALDKGGLETEITHFFRAEDALPSLEIVPLPFDLLVADYKLSGMTGLELCKRVIDKGISLPCIIVTGAGTENIAVKALKSGVSDYLVKDFQQNYLEILPLFLPEVVKKYRDRKAARIFKRERDVVAAISEMFLAPEDLETLCQKLPEPLASGFSFPVSAVLLLAENEKELIVKGISGVADTALLEKRVPIELTVCGQTISQGLPVLKENIGTDQDLNCLLKDSGIDTCLSVPIKGKKNGILGTILLADFKQRPDADIHISALQFIAQHLGQELERKQAEDELHLHGEIISNMAEGVFLVQKNSNQIVYANPVFEKMFGYEPGEMLGHDVSIVNAPSEKSPKDTVAMILEDLLKKGFWQGEIENIKKDGTPFWCNVTISGFNHHKYGKVWVSIHTDITDRKKILDALKKSKKEWTSTFDAMADIVTIQDKNMRIVQANRATHQLFQVNDGELNGKYCYEVFRGTAEPCPGCPLSDTIEDINNHSEIMTHENLGKIFHVSSAAISDANGDVQFFIHTAKDITKQKNIEEELFQAHKMEAIGTLAGGIAHDFNNILSAIIGFSELAQQDLPEGSSAGNDIDEVISLCRRAADLVQQILTFSRKSEHHLQSLNPHLIVKETLRMLGSSLPSTVIIHEDIDMRCGIIWADPTNIHQIIMNLCINALHAMEKGKGTLTVRLYRRKMAAEEIVQESVVSAGPFIVLSVSDTGYGMDEATKERIFEPYFTTKEGEGSGMGLAVIHGIIQDYKGFIRVDSTPGEGSTFSVYFPALQMETTSPEDSALKETENKAPLPSGNERLLIVDDELLLVRIHKKQLENCGYEVTATTDSNDALEMIRAHPEQFDLLVTDQTMPGLSGAELAKEVLRIKPSMPIIMCTGHSDIISEDDALVMGIKRYVYKPIYKNELLETVRGVLDEK